MHVSPRVAVAAPPRPKGKKARERATVKALVLPPAALVALGRVIAPCVPRIAPRVASAAWLYLERGLTFLPPPLLHLLLHPLLDALRHILLLLLRHIAAHLLLHTTTALLHATPLHAAPLHAAAAPLLPLHLLHHHLLLHVLLHLHLLLLLHAHLLLGAHHHLLLHLLREHLLARLPLCRPRRSGAGALHDAELGREIALVALLATIESVDLTQASFLEPHLARVRVRVRGG